MMDELSLFGDTTGGRLRRWEKNPVGWLGNAIGVAYARIAMAWSRGIVKLSAPDPRLPAFWQAFHARYQFDAECAARLQGRYPKNHDWDGSWYPRNDGELGTWMALVPYIRKTLFPLIEQFAEERLVPDCPVLHYRAGDVPFDRSPFYRLPRYGFYDWCIEQMQSRRWLIVTRLDAMRATPEQSNASERYLEDVRRHLSDRGVNSEVVDNRHAFDDLYTMIHAPYLLASMFSSFSYFAGIAKPVGRYLVARSPQTAIRPCWMHEEPPLPHEAVSDYLAVEKVLPLLRAG